MERITKDKLNKQVEWLNTATGDSYCLDWANGGVQIASENGARDISPRGTKRDISEYLRVMITAVYRYQGQREA